MKSCPVALTREILTVSSAVELALIPSLNDSDVVCDNPLFKPVPEYDLLMFVPATSCIVI